MADTPLSVRAESASRVSESTRRVFQRETPERHPGGYQDNVFLPSRHHGGDRSRSCQPKGRTALAPLPPRVARSHMLRQVERSLATDPAVGPNNGSGHVNLNPSLSNIQLTLYVASPALAPPTRIPQHRAVTEIGPSQQLPPPVATRCATNELRFQQGAPIPTTPRYSQTQRVARPTPPLPRTATPSAHQTTGRLRPVAQWSGTHRGDNLNEESESDSTDEDTYA
ncbi:hypothetical protein C8Q70DRAFT_1018741 [Cubamyces menziesii]|nr:hypothetical protein C8Q70DRAFT_1018741 [Cubamyces menziesii]